MSQTNDQPIDQKPSCLNCKYSFFILGQKHRECRRNPPQMFPVQQPGRGLGFMNQFPSVDPSLWCGQHERKVMLSS